MDRCTDCGTDKDVLYNCTRCGARCCSACRSDYHGLDPLKRLGCAAQAGKKLLEKTTEPQVAAGKPVQKMVLRIGQLEAPGGGGLRAPDAEDRVVWRTVNGMFGGVPLCARHAFELKDYLPDEELRAVFTEDQIESLVVEFGMRRQDVWALHGPRLHERCAMCATHYAAGNVCYNDDCKKPLHPQWPAVYCTDDCALKDR